ncbi:MAG TPA: DNA-3-methyladenine glycosylase I [Bacteroidales bacterium]|nr:DNA-3-methyladenine glycosylase I [Bacteroidales bacterium]
MERCPWCGTDPMYVKYHDEEWGVPVYDEQKQFEFLVLESMQAGLSWYIVLKKRENFRNAFAGFDPAEVAKFGEEKVAELLADQGIIRNKAKILAAINNAARFLEIQNEFGSFSNYIWGFVKNKPVINQFGLLSQIPASTPLSDTISRDLKKRGFKFLGTTVVYAHLQATGLVNDHLTTCFRWNQLAKCYR